MYWARKQIKISLWLIWELQIKQILIDGVYKFKSASHHEEYALKVSWPYPVNLDEWRGIAFATAVGFVLLDF